MIDLNQIVVTRWNPTTREYYESLGYVYTKHNDRFLVRAKDLPKNSASIVEVTCDCCGKTINKRFSDYNKVTNNNNGKYICKACSTRRSHLQRYPKENYYQIFIDFCNKFGYEPISTIDDCNSAKSKLRYICPKHGERTIDIDNIRKCQVGCRECSYEIISDKLKKSIEQVIAIVENNGNKLLNPEEYIDCKISNLKIQCGICGKVFTTSLESQRLSEGACPECGIKKMANSQRLSYEYLNKLYNSNGIVLLNPEDYVKNNKLNLKFICSECGEVFITSKANYDVGHTRCSKCTHSKSSGEILIETYLKNKNIDYIYSYSFDDCRDIKPLPFDFYLTSLNILIEFDGQLHYQARYGEDKLQNTQNHDKMKTEYAKQHNIKLIRIPYWEGRNIQTILDKELNIN